MQVSLLTHSCQVHFPRNLGVDILRLIAPPLNQLSMMHIRTHSGKANVTLAHAIISHLRVGRGRQRDALVLLMQQLLLLLALLLLRSCCVLSRCTAATQCGLAISACRLYRLGAPQEGTHIGLTPVETSGMTVVNQCLQAVQARGVSSGTHPHRLGHCSHKEGSFFNGACRLDKLVSPEKRTHVGLPPVEMSHYWINHCSQTLHAQGISEVFLHRVSPCSQVWKTR